jgi:hypothetical protein
VTAWAWVAIALLGALVIWLFLANLAAVRELASLRDRVEALEAASGPVHLGTGLPVGSMIPPWELTAPDGSTLASDGLAARRHIVVFADADCSACDALLPEVVRASTTRRLPPVVVVGRGDPHSMPPAWCADGVVSGTERDDEVSMSFHVEVSPHVFVVDEGGAIVAQGGATDLADVVSLVRQGEGLRIVGPAGA